MVSNAGPGSTRRPLAREHTLIEKDGDREVVVLFPELPNWVAMSKTEWFFFSLCDGSFSLADLVPLYASLAGPSEPSGAEARFLDYFTYLDEQGAFCDQAPEVVSKGPIGKRYSLVFLNATGACNLNCKYCYARTIVGEALLPISDWMEVVRRISECNPTTKFIIIGGEPFLRHDVLDLAEYICERGHKLVIVTNGTRITPPIVDRLKHTAVSVQVSLDGVNQEANSRTRTGDFSTIEAAIEQMRSCGIDVVIAPTFTTQNLNGFNDLRDFAAQKGCGYKPNVFMACGAGERHRELALSPDALFGLLGEEGVDPARLSPFRRKRGCGLGRELLAITPSGDITPCPFFQDVVVGNVGMEANGALRPAKEQMTKLVTGQTRRIWASCADPEPGLFGERNTLALMVDDLPQCSQCEFRYLCGGGCRAKAYAETGDVLAPDPSCGHIKEFFRRTLAKVSRVHPEL